MARTWSAVAVLFTRMREMPLPSWIAFGHHAARAKTTPSSFVEPKWPLRIRYATSVSQLSYVGWSLKLHGQP